MFLGIILNDNLFSLFSAFSCSSKQRSAANPRCFFRLQRPLMYMVVYSFLIRCAISDRFIF